MSKILGVIVGILIFYLVAMRKDKDRQKESEDKK